MFFNSKYLFSFGLARKAITGSRSIGWLLSTVPKHSETSANTPTKLFCHTDTIVPSSALIKITQHPHDGRMKC